MPIYEYACRKCKRQFEYMQRMNDPPKRKCEACGALALERQISQTSFHLKGGGWYKDLYSSPKPADAGKSEGAGSDAASGSSGSGSGAASEGGSSGSSGDSGSSGSSGSSGDSGSGSGSGSGAGTKSPGKDGAKDSSKPATKAKKGSR